MKYLDYNVDVQFDNYNRGGTAITLVDKNDNELVAIATAWIPDLQQDEIAIKDYSENTGMYQWLLNNNIVQKAHRFINQFPICRLCNTQ
jgi:hypothetical protein